MPNRTKWPARRRAARRGADDECGDVRRAFLEKLHAAFLNTSSLLIDVTITLINYQFLSHEMTARHTLLIAILVLASASAFNLVAPPRAPGAVALRRPPPVLVSPSSARRGWGLELALAAGEEVGQASLALPKEW